MPRHKRMNRAEYRRRRQHYLSLRLRAQIKSMREADRLLLSDAASFDAPNNMPTGLALADQARAAEQASEATYQALREELKTYRREEDMAAMEREIINHQLVQSGCLLGEEQAVTRLPRLKFGDGL